MNQSLRKTLKQLRLSGLADTLEVRLQEAGANRVGVTLWEVADEPTKNFMVGVYRRAVHMKMTFGAAVSETKREFIRSREFSDPYFWSAFVLYGR